jgi:molybdate transport system ATP-binding protein
VPFLVRLGGVSVRLGRETVLRDIHLDIAPGGHLAIQGGNGAGKSTLLRLIAGELWPTPPLEGGPAGVRLYDFGSGPEDDALTARQRVRLVGPELQDRYTARGLDLPAWQVVASGLDDGPRLRRRLTEADRQQLRKCLLRTGAQHLAEARFLQLSRGEQRRLLIARALMAEPVLLGLDEIGDGLDPPARARLLALLDRLAGQGITLVMATHHQDELPSAVRRVLRLEGGRLAPAEPARSPSSGSAAPVAVTGQAAPAVARGGPLIEVRKANVHRGGRRVLQYLDWCLYPGDRWLIRGGNGAGKSTFLQLLYGSLRPARGGAIRWFGLEEPVNVWELRRRIGFVSDELQAAYVGSLTVADCIATGFAASIGRVPPLAAREQAAVERCLGMLELEDLRYRALDRLSYGQRRRVLLARALVTSPQVLLLDEPMSGLDARWQERFRELLADEARRGTALVVVAHRDEPVLPTDGFYTHTAVLRQGRLVLTP